MVFSIRALARKGDAPQADLDLATSLLRARASESEAGSEAADPILLTYWPLARTNCYQSLLYGQGWRHAVATMPVGDAEVMEEVTWEGTVVCHFHWLASIDSEQSLRHFEALLKRLKEQGKFIVWTAHNVLPHDVADVDLAVRVRRAMVEAADLVHIINEKTAELVEPYYSLAGKRIFRSAHPSYLGDQPDTASREEARFELGLSPTATVFLSFGAIQPYKGTSDLLAAAERLDRDRPDLDWALVIAGEGKDRKLVGEGHDAAAVLGKRLLFLPNKVQVKDVQYFFRAADYCVLPYRGSLNSGAAMLSMSFGVPLVAPETAAFSDILTCGAGIGYSPVVEGGLPAAMIAAVERDPTEMRSHALAIAEERSPPVASDAFFDGLRRGVEAIRAQSPPRRRSAPPSSATNGASRPAADHPGVDAETTLLPPVVNRHFNVPLRHAEDARPHTVPGASAEKPEVSTDPDCSDVSNPNRTSNAMTWQAKWVAQRDGFENAERVLEIGAGGFATTISLATKFPDKRFFALDHELSKVALANFVDLPRNLSIIKSDARDLSFFVDGYFDFAFSVAVMEHIHELAAHLSEMHRIMSPDGSYWFWEVPYWSCSMGHHYRHSEADCPVPHYAHLYMPRQELRDYLVGKGNSREKSDRIVNAIYDRADLSRLSRAETLAIINNSKFSVETWEDDKDQHYDPSYEEKVFANNIYNISREDLQIKGSRAHLRRRPPAS